MFTVHVIFGSLNFLQLKGKSKYKDRWLHISGVTSVVLIFVVLFMTRYWGKKTFWTLKVTCGMILWHSFVKAYLSNSVNFILLHTSHPITGDVTLLMWPLCCTRLIWLSAKTERKSLTFSSSNKLEIRHFVDFLLSNANPFRLPRREVVLAPDLSDALSLSWNHMWLERQTHSMS